MWTAEEGASFSLFREWRQLPVGVAGSDIGSQELRIVEAVTRSSALGTSTLLVPSLQHSDPASRRERCLGSSEYKFAQEVFLALGAAGLKWED